MNSSSPESLLQRIADLQEQNHALQQQYQSARHEHQRRQLRWRDQQQVLVQLSMQRFNGHDPLREAAELFTRTASAGFEVERTSIWLLQDAQLHCLALYLASNDGFAPAHTLDISPVPAYLAALRSGRCIDAEDALSDPRTRELRHMHLEPLGIGAMLEASIRLDGEVVGVFCLEHVGGPRAWQSDELSFAGELADLFAQRLILQRQQEAQHTLMRFQQAIEHSSSGILLLDECGRVQYSNPAFSQITQQPAEALLGKLVMDLPLIGERPDWLAEMRHSLNQHNHWQGELHGRHADQQPYWVRLSLSRACDARGITSHHIGILDDITASRQSRRQLDHLAYSDGLTGLLNRSGFIRQIEQQLAADSQKSWSLLLDIDDFKRINGSLGHAAGDSLLIHLARRLRQYLPDDCLIARCASNEFAILLEADSHEAEQQARGQLLPRLGKPMFADSQPVSVSLSAGLACCEPGGSDAVLLMRQANLALDKAKSTGRGLLHVFTPELTSEAERRQFIESQLPQALARNQLELHCQPKLCLSRNQLVGLEALLRWHHPDAGLISPDQFIPVAESTGLILPIGLWVVRQACRLARQLEPLGHVPLAINLSARQFADPQLVEAIDSILREEQVKPSQLEIELTESLLLDGNADTLEQLQGLRALGLKIALDDFGTGYSSLSYLKKFPIDLIKIDRSFVRDIPHSRDDMELTSAVIAMAHKLGLEVVAEGIETREQLAFLQAQRCNVGQGYLFDRPLPAADLLQRLKRHLPGGPSA